MSPRESGPRVAGLVATRRWLMLLLFTIAWSFATLVGLSQFARLSAGDRALLVLGIACMVGGWAASRTSWGLWLLLGGPGCLVVAAALNGGVTTTGVWIALSVSASHVAYGVVLLAGRRIGIVGIAVMAVLVAVIWARRPTNVVVGPLGVAGGWIAIGTLVLSSATLWWVWNRLVDRAERADAAYRTLLQRTMDEIAAQERSRAWRSAAVVVHERLLSTIRYILQTPHLDRAGLAMLGGTSHAPALPGAVVPRSMKAATAARIAVDIVRIDDSALDLPITDQARQALRAALVECALNAVQHGQATEVVVTAEVGAESVVVRIADNGSGPTTHPVPGLGWSTVLDAGIGGVDGAWELSREGSQTVVSITLPTTSQPGDSATTGRDDGFDQGRILVSAPLAAHAVMGVAFDVLLGLGSGWGALLIAWSAAGTAFAALLVARAQRPAAPRSLGAVLALAAIPWLILLTAPPAGEILAVAAAINAAGYGLIAVAVWSRRWQWFVGLGAWTLGVVAFEVATPGPAAQPILVALLNCLVAVPVTVVVSSVGTRRFRRAQEALEAEREAIRRESLRSSAAALVDEHLSSCVTQADAIIGELAGGAELDDQRRHRLACLDGLIRATIQVDPLTSGGVAQAASQLVTSAFSKSVPITVGPLISSHDLRPIPRPLLRDLELVAQSGATPSIRVFSDPSRDYLCLQTEVADGPARAALDRCGAVNLDGMSVTVTDAGAGSVLVMVARDSMA